MNEERLQHLLHIAKHIDMDRLDMGLWGGCGTAACLAGWACRDSEFIAQGLTMAKDSLGCAPTFEDDIGFQALDAFFDLDGLESTHLFSPIAYSYKPTRVELLNHINDILAGDFIEQFGERPEYLDARRSEGSVEQEREEAST